jgi:hypothetical protein
MVIYSLGWNRVEYQFDQPFTLVKNTPDVKKLTGNTLEGSGGYGLIQFNGTFSELSFKNPILEAMYTIGSSGYNFGVPVVSTPATPATCQNFTYPIEGNGFVKNDTASVTKYCTQKSFTSGSIVSSDSNGAGTSTWNGTSWTFSGASQSYTKEVQCCGGTVSTPVCQSYPNAQAH